MVKIDDKCAYLKNSIIIMSKKVKQMYEMALTACENNDRSLALKVITLDEFVNLAQEDVNDIGIESLALLSPVASDLRMVIAGIKIANELERIGDYAKNIASFVIKSGPLDTQLMKKTLELGDVFILMLDHAMTAYETNDVESAMEIPFEDERIDELFEEITAILEQRIKDDNAMVNLIPTVNMMRNLERAGDHTKNICEHIIYHLKGQHIEFH